MHKITHRSATAASAVFLLAAGASAGLALAGDESASNSSTTSSVTAQNSSGNAAAQHSTGAAGSSAGTRSSTDTSSGAPSSSSAQGDKAGSVWLIVPVALESQSDRMSNGCWVKLYSGSNYSGKSITVVGPASIADLQSPYGTGLNNWESAVVGPRAMATAYDGDNFQEKDAQLKAGGHYEDLGDSKLGLFQDIESLRVNCNGKSGSAPGGTTGSAP